MSNPAPAPGELGLDEFRQAVEPFKALGFEREEVGRVEDLTVPRQGREPVSVRLFVPDADAPPPLLVWAHGGSWVRVTVALMENHYRVMANRSGCAIAAVDFRLAPESTYPGPIDEVYAAASWLKENSSSLGLGDRIAVGGDSSGGNLAAAAALLDRERQEAGFSLQVLMAPLLDTHFETGSWSALGKDYLLTPEQVEWALQQYAPGVDRSDPLLSPLRAQLDDRVAGAIIVTGGLDPLKDDGCAYAAALRDAGVWVQHTQVPGLIHHAMMAPKAIDKGHAMVVYTALSAGLVLSAAQS